LRIVGRPENLDKKYTKLCSAGSRPPRRRG